jgi:hypothetical protein
MRFWIPALLLLFLLGCRSKITDSTSDNGQPPPPPPPTYYVPAAPSNLHAAIQVGIGITVSWTDNSNNETLFELCHGPVGANPTCEQLAANTVTFRDETGLNENTFRYKVRAMNDSGASAWDSLDVGYRLQSDGWLPLRPGNWWEYRGTVGDTLPFRRVVGQIEMIGGLDYYRTYDSSMVTGAIDSIVYARNCSQGLEVLSVPLPNPAIPDTLLHYPNSPTFFYFRQDCVILGNVTAHMSVGDSVYSGVYSYQRFINHDIRHSFRYYIVPDSVGLIREEELVNYVTVMQHDIVRYHVGN